MQCTVGKGQTEGIKVRCDSADSTRTDPYLRMQSCMILADSFSVVLSDGVRIIFKFTKYTKPDKKFTKYSTNFQGAEFYDQPFRNEIIEFEWAPK